MKGSVVVKDLLWPAAAGNVLWSFLQLVLGPPAKAKCAYEVLLVVLGAYLLIEWLRAQAAKPASWRYWAADSVLVGGVVVVAIGVTQPQTPPLLLHGVLATVYVIAILGHLSGVWAADELRVRLLLACAAGSALLILIAGDIGTRSLTPWALPASFGAGLLIWVALHTLIAATGPDSVSV